MLMQTAPHPTAIDWQHRASANGGSTHNIHRDAADRLCKNLDSTGLAGKAVEIYPFLGDNIQAVCTKLRYALTGSSPVLRSTNFGNSNIIAFGGLKDSTNTSRALPTDMVYATALAFREPDVSAHWYTRDTVSGSSQVAIGSSASGNTVICGWVSSGTKESGTLASPTNYAVGVSTASTGFHGVANLAVRATQYFLNGVPIGAVGATGSGNWLAAATAVLFGNPTSTYWKLDMLYADFFIKTTSADELRLSQVVRYFQLSLNRA